MVIGKRQVRINVSQDAQDGIDDLISGKMLLDHACDAACFTVASDRARSGSIMQQSAGDK